ncbi:cell division protein SepF [uncultured Ilyobacter sp.]|jgi:cell division inhibitor SepF|uniref:cell division protein SepF n=1 Tax=uncultured Ilyobacter sp. TaxID=544433 RepID=UPI0029C09F93|nr:cell division protein SepF [uncultured Ilyobacter sp.]
MNFDIVFLKPEKFEECMNIVEHIRKERIVHINLSKLDAKNSQRVLDFVSGAVYIQEAQIIQPGEQVFCSVPKGKSYFMEGKEKPITGDTELIDLRYDEEEEIKPKFG